MTRDVTLVTDPGLIKQLEAIDEHREPYADQIARIRAPLEDGEDIHPNDFAALRADADRMERLIAAGVHDASHLLTDDDLIVEMRYEAVAREREEYEREWEIMLNEAVLDPPPASTLSAEPVERTAPPVAPLAVSADLMPAWAYGDCRTLHRWRSSWMWWMGTHWTELDEAHIKAVFYKRLADARYLADDQWKLWNPSRRKVGDVLDALTSLTYVDASVNPNVWVCADGVWPTSSTYVACANGRVAVPSRRLDPHTPQYFNTTSVPFAYDPRTAAPARWLAFLAELWPDDSKAIDALQEWFGYVVSGRTDLQKIFMIVGPARSGKGTIGRVLRELAGGLSNVAGPSLRSLGEPFGLQSLLGKPLAIIADARLSGADTKDTVERLLNISGEDLVDVNRKNRPAVTCRLPTRLMILSNEIPHLGDASGVIARRFVVLAQRVSFLGREDRELAGKLLAELPGILNWALDGLDRLMTAGRFTEPASSADAAVTMIDAASPMSAFVRECCEVRAGLEVSAAELFGAWRSWCISSGNNPGRREFFGRNLRSVVPTLRDYRPRMPNGDRPRHYQGIGLVVRDGPRPSLFRNQREEDQLGESGGE